MVETLDDLLGRLHSKDSQLVFLKNLYEPGNTEVGDLILSLKPRDFEVLEGEVSHAREQGLDGRFVDLAKRLAVQYIERNWTDSLTKRVLAWDNKEVAEHVVERLIAQGDEESFLGCASEIAKAFGNEYKARKCLEDLLELQRNSEDLFSSATTCVKLERYEEAIDFYSKGGRFMKALTIAREHSTTRVEEVAQKGFDEFNPSRGFWEDYIEYAEVIGKTREAKNAALKAAKKTENYQSPRFYEPLVKVLVKFGQKTPARNLIADIERCEIEREERTKRCREEDHRALAELYGIVGETKKAEDEFLALIGRAIKGRWHPSTIIQYIDRGYALTGANSLLDEKLSLLEKTQQYDNASQVATQMGKLGLADSYNLMAQMVAKAKHSE